MTAVVPRANVALPAKRTDRYGVLVQSRQVITEPPVDVPNSVEFRREEPGEERNEARGHEGVQQVLLALELGNDDVLPIANPREGDVQLPGDNRVGVVG